MENKKARGAVIAAVICLVLCFAAVVATCFMLENERHIVIISGGIVLGFIALACVSIILGNTFVFSLRCRRRAIKAMGMGSVSMVMKDKIARMAFDGIYWFIRGDFRKAEELLIKAHSLADNRNNQLFCLEWLGNLYEQIGDNAKLVWCHRKAVEYAPDNPNYQSRLGYDYFEDGKLDNAMHCFEKAVEYDPNNGFAHYNIACIHITRGEDETALQKLNELVKIQENHPLVFAELATLHAMRGEKALCEEAYQKAILCGYNEPEKLNARITALFKFNNAELVSGDDLPKQYYRYKVDKRDDRACSHECEYCSLHKKEEDEDNAGDE